MHALRRALIALVAAGAVAGALRRRQSPGPPADDGWRELTSNDFTS